MVDNTLSKVKKRIVVCIVGIVAVTQLKVDMRASRTACIPALGYHISHQHWQFIWLESNLRRVIGLHLHQFTAHMSRDAVIERAQMAVDGSQSVLRMTHIDNQSVAVGIDTDTADITIRKGSHRMSYRTLSLEVEPGMEMSGSQFSEVARQCHIQIKRQTTVHRIWHQHRPVFLSRQTTGSGRYREKCPDDHNGSQDKLARSKHLATALRNGLVHGISVRH